MSTHRISDVAAPASGDLATVTVGDRSAPSCPASFAAGTRLAVCEIAATLTTLGVEVTAVVGGVLDGHLAHKLPATTD